MPCTAKKFEVQRPDEAANGVPDVDYSLTTRELARMIRKVGIRFRDLPDEGFDAPLGLGTGAAVIFGNHRRRYGSSTAYCSRNPDW